MAETASESTNVDLGEETPSSSLPLHQEAPLADQVVATEPEVQEDPASSPPAIVEEEPKKNGAEEGAGQPQEGQEQEQKLVETTSTTVAQEHTPKALRAKEDSVPENNLDENGNDERGAGAAEEETPSVPATPSGSAATPGPGNVSGKKVSAKELIQHVKNQKRKLEEKEAEIAELQVGRRQLRMRALAMAIDIVSKAALEKRVVRAFHKWLAFADRESAALEVERVAGLAHKASSELETIRTQLEKVQAEKTELDSTQKKLRVLLTRAKKQIADQDKAHEQVPPGFGVEDVCRKVRAPDGTVYCLFAVRKADSKAVTYEWRTEELVLTWLAAGRGGEQALREKPTIEDELQARYSRASKELEAALADKQQEFDALNDRFDQFRRRAELALQKAGDSAQQNDGAAEAALREELARVSRDRDSLNERLDEIRSKLDVAESGMSALRLKEKMLREEKEELERRVTEAEKALEVARGAWEQTLKRVEQEAEERLRVGRAEVRASEERADAAEKKLEEAGKRELELKERERIAIDNLSRAEDKIEGLRAALARAEAKASSAEFSRHAASHSSSAFAQSAPSLGLQTGNIPSRNSFMSSTLSSPRPGYKSNTLPETAEVGDSASVVEATLRPRANSGDSELSLSAVGTAFEGGSKYFVDQIGSLREKHRNERAEWQKERTALREQIDDALRRKEQSDERVAALEKQIREMNLATERQKQLAESARTVGETPDGLLYLKNAVFRFITTDDDSERDTLLPVITLLLKFSPEEVQVLSQESRPQNTGLIQGFLSRFRG